MLFLKETAKLGKFRISKVKKCKKDLLEYDYAQSNKLISPVGLMRILPKCL